MSNCAASAESLCDLPAALVALINRAMARNANASCAID
jgi:hypothetical protein